MKFALCGISAMLLAACSSNVDTAEAVKQGVVTDLAKRMDVKNMDVNVDSVSFQDHQADAVVSFAPKGAPRAQGMSMRYKLERNGSQWHIVSRSSGDLQRHQQQAGSPGEGQGGLPAGHPAIGGESAPGGALPAGHPPIQSGETR